MITILNTDGTKTEIGEDQSILTLEWMQQQVGGLIEPITPSAKLDAETLILNEEGKLLGLPHNNLAQQWWNENTEVEDYIVGPAILLTPPNKLE